MYDVIHNAGWIVQVLLSFGVGLVLFLIALSVLFGKVARHYRKAAK